MADPLATVQQFEDRLGRALEPHELGRVRALLRDASARFRAAAAGQIINRSTSTIRVKACGGRVWLPQRPVISVESVTNPDDVELEVIETTAVDVEVGVGCETWLTVAYTHGYAESPDDVVGVVCQIAGRAFGSQMETAGVTSTTLGAFTQQQGGAAAQGAFGMLGDERAIAHGYRTPRRPVSML
jgi:hypothetical protein